MIYLFRYSTADDGSQVVDIAVIEDACNAQALEARGYTRCTRAAFRAAWQERDAAALAEMRAAVPEMERAVGEMVMLPNGFRLFKV